MSFPRSHYSGFPFNAESARDEFPFNRNRDGDLKSTLDDIAKRHPELAEHFQNLDQRPKSRNRPTEELKSKFRRPFADSFPFDDDFDIDKEFPQKFCDPKEFFDPQGHFPQTSSYQESPRRNEDNTHSQQTQTGATASQNIQPETSLPKSTHIPDKEKIGIQQSNTVDLGQKQEPIDDRNQRSMSAPPGGDTQKRYTSSINIPVNTPPENMSHNQQQHQEPKSNERIIPIQVEGRDIPVMPKNTHIPQTQSHQIPQRHEHFSRTGFPEEHFSQNFPYNFQQQHPKDDVHIPVQRENPDTEQRQHQSQPQQSAPQPPQSAPQPQKVDTQEAKAPPPERKQVVTPIELIQEIQKDVSNLMQQVENFTGKSKDKQYLYLDEMLTRNLIKLDNIDTQGQENIRLSRKEAIRCIQQAISLLENKAVPDSEAQMKTNDKSQSAAEEKPPAVSNNDNGIKPEETNKGNSIENQKTESQPSTEIEKMETTENNVNDPNQPADSKEVSSESTNQETRAVLVDAKDVNVHENEAVVTELSNQDTMEDQKNDKCEKGEKNKCSQK